MLNINLEIGPIISGMVQAGLNAGAVIVVSYGVQKAIIRNLEKKAKEKSNDDKAAKPT